MAVAIRGWPWIWLLHPPWRPFEGQVDLFKWNSIFFDTTIDRAQSCKFGYDLVDDLAYDLDF